jgi:hypothetical protein
MNSVGNIKLNEVNESNESYTILQAASISASKPKEKLTQPSIKNGVLYENSLGNSSYSKSEKDSLTKGLL